MPRNVRNFWIATQVDGRKTHDATGPRRKDGGFRTSIEMRYAGAVTHALTIEGVALDGELRLVVYNETGECIHTYDTYR